VYMYVLRTSFHTGRLGAPRPVRLPASLRSARTVLEVPCKTLLVLFLFSITCNFNNHFLLLVLFLFTSQADQLLLGPQYTDKLSPTSASNEIVPLFVLCISLKPDIRKSRFWHRNISP
jgi:hypothetical protein